jgi:hypothetical protein
VSRLSNLNASSFVARGAWSAWSAALAFLLAVCAAKDARAGAAPGPRFAGADTTVAVNRLDGRIAVLRGDHLDLLDRVTATKPTASIGIPGRQPAVQEFCGNTILYVTHEVRGLATAYVAISATGREWLAWPNEGLSELFPIDTSRLTLDGKGVFDTLTLGPKVREYFGLPDSIPDGAGVVATFRFAGEKMAARGSTAFGPVVALTPDDMLIALRGGGVMRYRSPGGVLWKHEGAGGTWRIADAEGAGLALVLDGEGALVALDLDAGKERFRWDPSKQASAVTKWLAHEGGGPQSAGGAPRLLDARRLRSGQVLVLGESGSKWLGVVDPSSGRLMEGEVLSRLHAAGDGALADFWAAHNDSLAQTWELPVDAGGATLLMRGADGWYEVRLR